MWFLWRHHATCNFFSRNSHLVSRFHSRHTVTHGTHTLHKNHHQSGCCPAGYFVHLRLRLVVGGMVVGLDWRCHCHGDMGRGRLLWSTHHVHQNRRRGRPDRTHRRGSGGRGRVRRHHRFWLQYHERHHHFHRGVRLMGHRCTHVMSRIEINTQPKKRGIEEKGKTRSNSLPRSCCFNMTCNLCGQNNKR